MICKQCGKDKPEKEFPWLLQRVCHDCHMWNAMHWNEISWPESKHKKNLSPAERERRRLHAKSINGSRSDITVEAEGEETTKDTEQLKLMVINAIIRKASFEETFQ